VIGGASVTWEAEWKQGEERIISNNFC